MRLPGLQSELDALTTDEAHDWADAGIRPDRPLVPDYNRPFRSCFHEHRYKGGPPPKRIRKMQIAHEGRARRAGVPWDTVDLRAVYRACNGECGICGMAVSIDDFTIDHIVPLCKGGPHIPSNLQVAHLQCNTKKGRS